MACCGDWLVLFSKQSHYSLWNIMTLESIALPPVDLDSDRNFDTCVLSSPPGTADSRVLLFDRSGRVILFFRLVSNYDEWTEVKFGEKELSKMCEVAFDRFDKIACCNGVIYATPFCNVGLCRIDTDDHDPNKLVLRYLQTSLPYYDNYSTPHVRMSLVESGGELFTISIFLGGIRWNEVVAIEVYKLILSTKEWVKVNSCKDRVFFLGKIYNVSCPAWSELEGSRIYFTRSNDRMVYSYNIEERSLSIAFCAPNLRVKSSIPTWILQRHEEKSDDQPRKEEPRLEVETVNTEVISERNAIEDSKDFNLHHLALELLEKVAHNLGPLDYMNFRAACRVFSSAAPAVQWKEATRTIHSLSPCLIFTSKDRKVFDLIDPEQSGRYFMNIPTELGGTVIHYSKDGWLLMSRNQKSFFFFNPFTKIVLPWPKLAAVQLVAMHSFAFSSVPTSSDCMVLGITDGNDGVGVCVVHSGNSECEYMEFVNELEFVPNHNAAVQWNGDFYFLSQKGNIGVLTVEGESYDWKILDELGVPCKSFHQSFLVQCDKELLSIFVGDCGKCVRVFRMDLPNSVWKEVHSLGNQTIFLSRSSALSVVAKSKEMENRIYFPRLLKGKMVFYSLETRKFHPCSGEDSLVDYAGTVEQLLCGWLEPRWI